MISGDGRVKTKLRSYEKGRRNRNRHAPTLDIHGWDPRCPGGYMSGGHYDYYQYHITDVADKMEADLARIGTQNQWEDEPYGLEDSTIATLRMAIALLRASADIVHDVDWCMSDDTGEDTLRRDLYKWSLKHEAPLEKAIDRALDYMEST